MSNYVQKEITDLPVDLVEPVGNLIRKIAYTQLSSVRLIGISIETNDVTMKYAMLTSTIEGTTTLLDIIPYLNNELTKDFIDSLGLNNLMESKTSATMSFTDLKETLSKFMDVSNVPDNLLTTNEPHNVRFRFCRVGKDMDCRSLQAFMPEGFIPIPTTVLKDFKLDYSEKANGILKYSISDEFSEQLNEKITDIMGIISSKI